MSDDAIRQIFINGRPVGLIGLDAALAEAANTCSGKSDDDVARFLLNTLASKNYIPSSAHASYSRALLREYKLFQNLPVEPEPAAGLTILVLGMGCARCDQLQSDLRDVLSELNVAADLRHITDVREIARFGVLGAPALVINNKVVCVGQVPSKNQIRAWIAEANIFQK